VRCEVCGSQIYGKPRKVMIEGAKMIVCEKCAKLGSPYLEPENKPSRSFYRLVERRKRTSPAIAFTARRRTINLPENLEIRERFGSLVRKARENMGLSHEELGKKIGEKVSVLKKIESEKMIPDQKLAKKLEHALKVKLLVPSEEYEVPGEASAPPSQELTLGEIAQLKISKRRNRENESNNSSSKTSV